MYTMNWMPWWPWWLECLWRPWYCYACDDWDVHDGLDSVMPVLIGMSIMALILGFPRWLGCPW
jgi:hypothetical protein